MSIFNISTSLFGSNKTSITDKSVFERTKERITQMSISQKVAAIATVFLAAGAIAVGSLTAAGFIATTLGMSISGALVVVAALTVAASVSLLKKPAPVASTGWMNYAYQHPGRMALGAGAILLGIGAIGYACSGGDVQNPDSTAAPTTSPAPSPMVTPTAAPTASPAPSQKPNVPGMEYWDDPNRSPYIADICANSSIFTLRQSLSRDVFDKDKSLNHEICIRLKAALDNGLLIGPDRKTVPFSVAYSNSHCASLRYNQGSSAANQLFSGYKPLNGNYFYASPMELCLRLLNGAADLTFNEIIEIITKKA